MSAYHVKLFNDITHMLHSEHTVYADDENGAKDAAIDKAKAESGHDDTRLSFPSLRAAVTQTEE